MSNDLGNRLECISNKIDPTLYPDFPHKNLLIEITNNCNSNCIFCANRKMTRKRGFINSSFVTRILKEAYYLGVREVGFYTVGEPLLDSNLENYIFDAKKIGYKYVYITTNGILLNKERIKSLILSGLDSIKLSINAINMKDYKFIHGTDKFDIVLNNLINLYNFRKENNLNFKIYVSYISTRYNDKDINEIKSFFKLYCDDVAVINVRNQSGMMPEISYLSCVNEENKIKSQRNVPCYYVFNSLNVTCEGYLTACCTDFQNYLVYADLNKVSLKEAWHNKIITELRKKHLNNDICGTLCYNCIYSRLENPKPLIDDLATECKIYEDENILEKIKLFRKED